MEDLAEHGQAQAIVEARTDTSGSPVVKIAGEVDLSNVEVVRSAVDAALEPEVQRVLFDLSELRFIDSSGLAMLVGIASRVAVVELQDPLPIVRRCLELTSLTSVFVVTP
jgi:anti-anti-sigma factor